MPAISVIVPVYNVEKYIHRCVDSILAQTFTDFELILVDDGSPDNCGAICDEYAAKDGRVHVIHRKNGGLSAARNAGIDWAFANSGSAWLSFIDSDDWVHPKYLEALYGAAVETGLKVSVCGFQRTDGVEPEVNETRLAPAIWNTEEFYCKERVTAIAAWGKLYAKERFAEIRYPVGKIHEDEFTTYRIIFRYDNLAVIAQPLYAYFQNPGGIMNAPWSPARLSQVEALAEQLAFFEREKFQNAFRRCVRSNIGAIYFHLRRLEQCDKETRRRYTKPLREKLRRFLWKYRRGLPLLKYRGAYAAAYCPLLHRWYKAIKGKIKTVIKPGAKKEL